jgi:hypothetical protein
MTEEQQAHLETLYLLSTTGELTQQQADELRHAEAAGFIPSFIFQAPRDFAAEAISTAMPLAAPADYAARAIRRTTVKSAHRMLSWAVAAAAAVAFFIGSGSLFLPLPAAAAPPRQTVAISAQLDAIEQELNTQTPRIKTRSRSHS